MADGELVLKLDDETARRLQEAADAAGQSLGDYAAGLLERSLDEIRWRGAEEALAEFDRTGESADAVEVMNAFYARVRSRAAD